MKVKVESMCVKSPDALVKRSEMRVLWGCGYDQHVFVNGAFGVCGSCLDLSVLSHEHEFCMGVLLLSCVFFFCHLSNKLV